MEEELEREREQRDRDTRSNPEVGPPQAEPKQWLALNDSSSVVNLTIGRSSPPDVSGFGRNASPRRMGRSRTDTMVYSEAANVAEELARNDTFTEAALDKAIAEERLLSAVAQPLPETFAPPSVAHHESEPEHEPEAEAEATHAESHEPNVPGVIEPEEDAALPQEAEVLLEIAAPAPAEPAIPVDVDEEEDITEDSSAEHVDVELDEVVVEEHPAEAPPKDSAKDQAEEDEQLPLVEPEASEAVAAAKEHEKEQEEEREIESHAEPEVAPEPQPELEPEAPAEPATAETVVPEEKAEAVPDPLQEATVVDPDTPMPEHEREAPEDEPVTEVPS